MVIFSVRIYFSFRYFSLFAKLCCVENSNIFPTAKTHTEKNIICYLLIGESISYVFLCQCFSLTLTNFHHSFVIQNSRHHRHREAAAEVCIKNGKVLFEFDELQWCVLIHFYAWEHERGWDSEGRKKKLWEIAYACLAHLMKPNVELKPNLNFLSNAFLYAKATART